jgi:ATP/maltotriose-dependent transcriptional regulator MalT
MMVMTEEAAPAALVTEIWSQVRALSDDREVDLDLRLLGKPEDLSLEAGRRLREVVATVVESARSAVELHHLALEFSYQPQVLNIRIEHDGTLEPAGRGEAERSIFGLYGDIGGLGGSMVLSSGRGYGIRVELTLPYGESGVRAVVETAPSIPERARMMTVSAPEVIAVERLTPQEDVTLSLLAAGFSNKEIADRMQLGVGTVKYHLAQIYQKLGVQGRGRGAAVARARELGLLFD